MDYFIVNYFADHNKSISSLCIDHTSLINLTVYSSISVTLFPQISFNDQIAFSLSQIYFILKSRYRSWMYLTRIMTTINTSQSCRPTFNPYNLDMAIYPGRGPWPSQAFYREAIFSFPSLKNPHFLPLYNAHFKHPKKQTRTRSGARSFKRTKAIHLFIGLIRYIFNCLKPFPNFNHILNYSKFG